MNKKVIQVSKLKKSFTTFKKNEGLWASVKDFFYRQSVEKIAVNEISFDIDEGEFVGFVGPNGAGKTTTLKMLSGILTPTSGELKVLGYEPWKRAHEFKKQFSIIMGQKNQLWWDLPPLDSYELFRHMYEIPKDEFKKNLDFLADLLDARDFLEVQTRKLSLGQRMKAELIGALIHKPKLLFLDEPTIGLDVVSQSAIRDFLKKYNQETRATILLTSHYMEDIRRLCSRVMIIDHGSLLYDGTYSNLINKFVHEKTLSLRFQKEIPKKDLEKFGKILQWDGVSATLAIPREEAPALLAKVMKEMPVEDLTIQESSMEDVVRDIFTQKHV